MYDDGIEKGMSHEEVVKFLGYPDKVAGALSENYSIRQIIQRSKGNRLVALMPFLSLSAFFILGMVYHLWHPAWMVFLAIPVTAILVGNQKLLPTLTALSPFLAVISFLLLGFYLDAWNPGWLVFLLIPLLGALNDDRKGRGFTFALLLLLASGAYLYVGYTYGEWTLGALGFAIPLIYSIWTAQINIDVRFRRESAPILLSILVATVLFFLIGYFANAWEISWLAFFLIPVTAILMHHRRHKNTIVALMPFISTSAFMIMGMYFQLWSIAWLVFLLIPVTAILVNGNKR